MSMHNIQFNTVQCSQCDNFAIPFKKNFECPFCGHATKVHYDFIDKAVEAMRYHKKRYGQFFPGAWYSGSFAEYVQGDIFRFFDLLEVKNTKPTKEIVLESLNKAQYPSEGFKKHFTDLILAVYVVYEQNDELNRINDNSAPTDISVNEVESTNEATGYYVPDKLKQIFKKISGS